MGLVNDKDSKTMKAFSIIMETDKHGLTDVFWSLISTAVARRHQESVAIEVTRSKSSGPPQAFLNGSSSPSFLHKVGKRLVKKTSGIKCCFSAIMFKWLLLYNLHIWSLRTFCIFDFILWFFDPCRGLWHQSSVQRSFRRYKKITLIPTNCYLISPKENPRVPKYFMI